MVKREMGLPPLVPTKLERHTTVNDTRSKQWFVKVHYNGQLIEVREIWSDTQNMAQIYAHKHAVSSMDTQMETPEETSNRLHFEKYNKLSDEINELEEFLYDDYGDTVKQLGREKTAELEAKYNALRKQRSEMISY